MPAHIHSQHRRRGPDDAVDRASRDAQAAGDLGMLLAVGQPRPDDLRHQFRPAAAPLELAVCLGLGDPLPLPLEHDLPLPGRHAGQDGQHQLRRRVARVERQAAHGQHEQADTAFRQVRLDLQQFLGRPRQAIGLRHCQHIALTKEA